MVERWGTEIEERLNSPHAVRDLRQCTGIGATKATQIKAGWDECRGRREATRTLVGRFGMPLALAQHAADALGPNADARVASDPWEALCGLGLALGCARGVH
jgi:hypothetical protein